MKKKIILCLFVASVLFTGCAKKTQIPKADVSRLEAEQAIALAQSEIDEAEEVGADVSEPKEIISEAGKMFENEKYAKAKDQADRAAAIARNLKQEILAQIRMKEDAQAAIERAEKLINNAKSLGGNVREPEDLLSKAEDEFSNENYSMSISYADSAAEKAQQIINSLKAEKYVVGTWEADRDCLWNIAKKKKIYNDPWKWKRIYRANQEKIKDPDLIYPGQVLMIPRD
ncbi:MAG: LysM peptidoglycan-binding domain-containing protein [Elusimicrobiota bacterium]